ncbi:MAG TPA: cytochrome c biogenesis protein CcdA [Mesorhizobium sp.]|nr:cytochrome c biogenesis protein CcdA [Mesorhizobium sp.]
MLDVGLPAAFGAGILSFLSPCILPLVPSYLCFLAGASLETLTRNPGGTPNARLIGRAVAFVLGFAVVFVALGASASGVGRLVSENLTVLTRIAGLVIVLLGLHMTGLLRFAFLLRETRLEPNPPMNLAGAFVVGLAFGFGWTPCVGPVLTAILLLAGTQGTVGEGATLLGAYAAGIGVPFVSVAFFIGPFMRWLARFAKHLGTIEKAMGVALVITGLLILSGSMPAIGNWLLEYAPALGRIG